MFCDCCGATVLIKTGETGHTVSKSAIMMSDVALYDTEDDEQSDTEDDEQAVANIRVAAQEAVAYLATYERAIAARTGVIAVAEEAVAIAAGPEEEIGRLQHLLRAEQAATAAATAAAKEAAATATNLEVEIRRLQLLLSAEKASTAAKVFVPGYVAPMTRDEHLQALHSQVQYLPTRAALRSSEPFAILGRQSPHGRDCQRCGDRHGNHQSGTSKRQRTLKGGAHSIIACTTHCQEQFRHPCSVCDAQ
jgi:hypothetical protein